MGRKEKNRKIPRTNQGLSFAVGTKGHGIDHWTREATNMNRQLAKTRTNGKTEYVGPHVRHKKDGTEVKVEGYFRRPKYGPHIHQTKREISGSN